ncbi:hypothetical protein [Ligilactobacillus salivarius]|uniref:Uncharacterized protein n=1 Tax=Ligilactobacillus salivarius TaxID=1624 RepID=A0A9X6S8P2_9LACO|nr:hypothetical protein [Ligilactobacillus salivarius]OTF89713.1 hypothetical protein A8C38_00080 [Ligilactobacillus salivarius]PAY43548.1 hypothetical protein A8C39_00260 [Ligilactobacillus salivarius]PAY49141.1 hypothetical protein A8C52_11960 [Ligilactobacillus salivarius]PAY49362.1 hypothetical protein A8C42_00410 [Ligilactobacillus salivarius]PAY52510.1 hypothetical protein A8C41_09045 [Ligilactobacillus salivarius]
MTEQIIKDWQVPSREERETILTYEEETNQWHIYSDVPKHARKYEKFIDESKNHRKGYNINGGQLAMIDGYVIGGNVGIRKKMSDKERKAISERMKKLREENKL